MHARYLVNEVCSECSKVSKKVLAKFVKNKLASALNISKSQLITYYVNCVFLASLFSLCCIYVFRSENLCKH